MDWRSLALGETGGAAVTDRLDQIRAASEVPRGLPLPAPEFGTTCRRASSDDPPTEVGTGEVRRRAAREGQVLATCAAVTETAATALVAAMATSAWPTTRSEVAWLFERRTSAGVAAIEAQLDAHAALVAQADDAEEARRDLALTWRLQLEVLLRQHPKAENDLRILVVRVWETLPSSQQTWMRNAVAHQQATQHASLGAGGQSHFQRGGIHPGNRSSKQRASDHHIQSVAAAQEIAWLIAHLRALVAAGPATWQGKRPTLLQLTALHFIQTYPPVTLTDLAQALGTTPPATSAIVDRLIRAGLVCNTPNPQDRQHVQLTTTPQAEPMINEINPTTTKGLHAALHDMGPQARRYLIDVLRHTVRRSVRQPKQHPSRQ